MADVYLHTCHGLKGSTAGTQLQVLSTEHLLHLASKKVTEPQNHVCWKESLAAKWSYILFKAGPVRAGWSGLAQLHFEYPEEWRLYSLSGHLLQCLTTLTGGERGSLKKKNCLFLAIPYIETELHVFWLVSLPSCPATMHLHEEIGSISSISSH